MSSENEAGQPEEGERPEDAEPTGHPNDAAGAKVMDRPQEAWAARWDLVDHTPRTMAFGEGTHLAGGVLGGVNHGIGGGSFHGDVHLGATTHIHYGFGGLSTGPSSGEIRAVTLTQVAECFADPGPPFAELVDRLRKERVLVLSGPHSSGRRTAALMLLHRLGLSPVHSVARDTAPSSLVPDGEEQTGARGHLLCDLETDRNKPLREVDLLALRDRLTQRDAYLVITVGPRAHLEDVKTDAWQPPPSVDVLSAHLRARLDPDAVASLLALPVVTEFLARTHQPRETSEFASTLLGYAAGDTDERQVENFSLAALEGQVREWFEEDDTVLHLREKAFLIALAAFDDGPYALTAEVSDRLYARLQRTADSQRPAAVPVFGTHIGKRLELARAHRYEAAERTEWGPVQQVKAAYLDDRTSLVLLREVWTGHPSARPALVQWLQDLAKDGRPLVRTRASSTAAVLAHTDLPSAMALVIEPWAASPLFGPRTVAVHALTLAHHVGTPNVPRILDAWCDSNVPHLRWVAIRTHGLIGPERPMETMAALRTAARREEIDEAPDPDGLAEGNDEKLSEVLAESVELLLLSQVGDQVLGELLRTLDHDQKVRALALNGFLNACGRTDRDASPDRPLVLDWYATSLAARAPASAGIPVLLRTALNDRVNRRRVLDVLRRWVLSAEDDPEAERALARLLSVLVTSEADQQRISHLLHTVTGDEGIPPPVAHRLLGALPLL
ncbi:hypothetical protein [Streptomyces sp. ITFR-6]|uniref:hypothetical protein n=1 Tax=Streptomyces sp. ITFR-6 TaxID=3075197 RepID=UPI00288933C2|nr:hypothetical protein [Streptomyces sp. ITFR-6]WNI29862.1 hypothetical protein RLT59_14445 [Streptomyces sp. ITFR-6]